MKMNKEAQKELVETIEVMANTIEKLAFVVLDLHQRVIKLEKNKENEQE